MKEWEYKTRIIYYDNWTPELLDAKLLEFGKNGWELIQIVEKFFFFKRPIESNILSRGKDV